MDCKSFGALKDVPGDKAVDYIACLQSPAAGNIQGQASDGVGLYFFIILCVLAVWQLLWAKGNVKTFWSCALGLGLLGLGYLLGF
jgi:hypothetical protein